MRKLLFFVAILLLHSLCLARDPISGYGTLIAIEFKTNNNFNHAVGKLEYTGESIDIVGFTEGLAGIGIIATPAVYLITEKNIRTQGIHNIKGKNQYGVTITGYIDFRDEFKPKINLLTDGGTLITNISAEGKAWKIKHIPHIVLGQ